MGVDGSTHHRGCPSGKKGPVVCCVSPVAHRGVDKGNGCRFECYNNRFEGGVCWSTLTQRTFFRLTEMGGVLTGSLRLVMEYHPVTGVLFLLRGVQCALAMLVKQPVK